ncbi:uncharacterized protein THITE_2131004 [Thermothielavioides terrestris NRRL 8126]|uniref:Uncharacterized protein n=1 Tax=Thermothielavioides terrestris (strain ATCC 38088 / NRRL 8126) TaxID=578455 RepID=G2RC69_THETT|nr:uncharacterized protein THITE_2131004 [Thermothielavioides terrestris NRRL 8126]AEO69390.1 hypothetical protein THITE_2131004 [Thermothielavioides terrestris NRRL 8126]
MVEIRDQTNQTGEGIWAQTNLEEDIVLLRVSGRPFYWPSSPNAAWRSAPSMYCGKETACIKLFEGASYSVVPSRLKSHYLRYRGQEVIWQSDSVHMTVMVAKTPLSLAAFVTDASHHSNWRLTTQLISLPTSASSKPFSRVTLQLPCWDKAATRLQVTSPTPAEAEVSAVINGT